MTALARLPLFVDTGGWIALNDPRDSLNSAASKFYRDQAFSKYSHIVTTNLVVAETHAYLLKVGAASYGLKYLSLINSSTRVTVIHSTADLEEEAYKLLSSYKDQDFTLCDAVSFSVMKELGIKDAFAFDSHFETAGFCRLPMFAE